MLKEELDGKALSDEDVIDWEPTAVEEVPIATREHTQPCAMASSSQAVANTPNQTQEERNRTRVSCSCWNVKLVTRLLPESD